MIQVWDDVVIICYYIDEAWQQCCSMAATTSPNVVWRLWSIIGPIYKLEHHWQHQPFRFKMFSFPIQLLSYNTPMDLMRECGPKCGAYNSENLYNFLFFLPSNKLHNKKKYIYIADSTK